MHPDRRFNIRFIVEARCPCHPGFVGRGEVALAAIRHLEERIERARIEAEHTQAAILSGAEREPEQPTSTEQSVRLRRRVSR
jgi:hypothetical protein